MDTPGGRFWTDWKRYVDDHLLGNGLIDRDDLALFRITDSIDDAIEEVRRFYRVYHSSRTIRNRLVVRTQFPVSDRDVAEISAQFSDILGGKPAARRQPYDEEHDEPTLLELPRLVLHFDMKSYGRLRQLVDRLNASERD
jgi:hypothetical protein